MSQLAFDAGGGAILSDDGVYRYVLTRRWELGPMCLFVMLNPSTADAHEDDATIRRCVGFAKSWGFGGLSVVNLYAYRATDPVDLLDAHNRHGLEFVVGPDNDTYIAAAVKQAALTVIAWGAHPAARHRADQVLALVTGHAPIGCLGLTAGGHPVHPVRQAKVKVPLNPITLLPVALPPLRG